MIWRDVLRGNARPRSGGVATTANYLANLIGGHDAHPTARPSSQRSCRLTRRKTYGVSGEGSSEKARRRRDAKATCGGKGGRYARTTQMLGANAPAPEA